MEGIFMKTGFGIAGLIVAILAIIVPAPINVILTLIAILLVCISAFAGDRPFAIITVILAAVNLFILSPLTLASIAAGGPVSLLLAVTVLALPILAIMLNASGKVVFGK
jgi:hypothetical protein